jgi:Xaa-Pro aminopeptidase
VAQADYARRIEAARARLAAAGLDALLVTSAYNRRYLTGFTAHDGDINESAGWVLVTPKTIGLVTGTFSIIGVEHEFQPSGVQVLLTDETLPYDVVAKVAQEEGLRRLGFEKDWISYDRYDRVRKALPTSTELVPSEDLIKHVRARKDDAEVATMRRAAQIADQAFAELTRQIKVGMTEREIASLLDQLFKDFGAEGPSFPTIVACGPGGAQPHAVPTDRPVRASEPLLIDFGCRYEGYCSDATRTFCIGEPDPKLVEIYGIVRRAQDAAVAALQSGVRRGRDVDAAARQVVDDAGYKDEFMHSLGHGVGLAVHELPVLARLRINTPELDAELARVEQIGNHTIVTNEPGIYVAGWGGVRLEDMLLVTDDGVELLTERNPERILRIPG